MTSFWRAASMAMPWGLKPAGTLAGYSATTGKLGPVAGRWLGREAVDRQWWGGAEQLGGCPARHAVMYTQDAPHPQTAEQAPAATRLPRISCRLLTRAEAHDAAGGAAVGAAHLGDEKTAIRLAQERVGHGGLKGAIGEDVCACV